MSDHKTFCAFGAYAVNVIDPHATVVMLLANAAELPPPIVPTKLVTLDLHQRLGAENMLWEDTTLDTLGVDRGGNDKMPAPEFPHGVGIDVLTVGPLFHGQHVGGIYMERTKFFRDIRPVLDPNGNMWPHPGLHPYEVMSSASRKGDIISRYHGFHARVTVSKGSIKTLDIKGTQITVDMNNREVCDDPALLTDDVQDPRRARIERVLDLSSGQGDEGAIFLSLKLAAQKNLQCPKEPPGGGGL